MTARLSTLTCTKSHSMDAWEDISHTVSDCSPVKAAEDAVWSEAYPNGSSTPAYDWMGHAGLVYADGRDEHDSCERLTPGCSVDHTRSQGDVSCEGW